MRNVQTVFLSQQRHHEDILGTTRRIVKLIANYETISLRMRICIIKTICDIIKMIMVIKLPTHIYC